MKLMTVPLLNQSAQVNDTAVFRFDLPTSGLFTAIDIRFGITNGATSAINLDPIDIIKRISIVMNGNENRYYLTGQQSYRMYLARAEKPLLTGFNEGPSAVNFVWFRIPFGRDFGDTQYGLDLSRYDNVQVQIDYDATVWGAASATTFTTGTCQFTLVGNQFSLTSRPSFKGMIGIREFGSATSVASGSLQVALPSARPVTAVTVFALQDNVAENQAVTDIMIGKDSFNTVWTNNKWYNLRAEMEALMFIHDENYQLLLSDGAVRDTHVSNIVYSCANNRVFTKAVA